MSFSHRQAEVVVVGAGLAGLVAATSAAEAGARVTVLESGSDARYPANSRYTGGVFHLAFTDITSSPDDLLAALREASAGTADDALLAALADSAGETVDWLAAHGAVFGQGGEPAWMSRMLVPFSLREPGFEKHWPDKGAERLLDRLATGLPAAGGDLRRGVRARELTTDGERVTGVRARTAAGADLVFPADAVVLADGGFQGNADMVREYISPDPAKLCRRGAGTGMGDGILMARAAGARLTGMDRFYGHVQCREALDDDRLWPYPIFDVLAASAVVVDASGRRFADEGLGGVAMANAIAKLEDPLSAFVVMTERIWDTRGRDFLLPPNPTVVERGAHKYEAATLAGLAGQIGVPPAALEQTVADYDEALRTGAEDTLLPPRTNKTATLAATALPLEDGPYVAFRLCAGITYTMGGLAVDAECRVLRDGGRVVPSLYAAGSTTGGFEGGPRSVYLGGLARAAILGLRAGRSITAALQPRTVTT